MNIEYIFSERIICILAKIFILCVHWILNIGRFIQYYF